MIVPPAKASNSVEMYDSVVDNMATPNMFIIFHDDHAYPEYLITFKWHSQALRKPKPNALHLTLPYNSQLFANNQINVFDRYLV